MKVIGGSISEFNNGRMVSTILKSAQCVPYFETTFKCEFSAAVISNATAGNRLFTTQETIVTEVTDISISISSRRVNFTVEVSKDTLSTLKHDTELICVGSLKISDIRLIDVVGQRVAQFKDSFTIDTEAGIVKFVLSFRY